MPSAKRSATDQPAPDDDRRAGFRHEALLVAGIVLLGFVLRGLRPGAMAVEHFDEGVYASNLYCGHLDPPFAYPMRHLYAPPLFPAILEWAQILAGPPAVMWVNVLLGSLTVVAVWWTTRCSFGRPAAIAAAMLAATSEYHIAFSRMALTDVPLALFMLLGVFAGWRAIVSGRPLWIVAAGMLAGLAWCTKYNGWLTLAVTGSGTLAAFIVPWLLATLVPKLQLGNELPAKLLLRALSGSPASSGGNKKIIANCKLQIANLAIGASVVRWVLTAAIAGVMFWWFVVRDLAPLGGYAAVAKNHAGYFVGVRGWWSGFIRQAVAHDLLQGWMTCVGIGAAWLACYWSAKWTRDRSVGFSPRIAGTDVPAPNPHGLGNEGRSRPTGRWIVAFSVGLVLMLCGRLLTASGLMAIAALAGFVCVVRRAEVTGDDTPTAGQSAGEPLAAWLLLAWFFGLVVSVPLYYPYPRLSLPWVVACWPLAGAALAAMARWLRREHRREVGETNADEETRPIGQLRPATSGVGAAPPISWSGPRRTLMAALLLAVVVGMPLAALDGFIGPHRWSRGRSACPSAWARRDLLRTLFAPGMLLEIEGAAAERTRAGSSEVAAVVYVEGDPAAFYQLCATCRTRGVLFQPIADADGLRQAGGVPTFVVTHRQAGAPAPDIPDLEFHSSVRNAPSDLVLLDRMPAGELSRLDPELPDDLRLYRIDSGSTN